MYGSEASQFFGSMKRALKINYKSSAPILTASLVMLRYCHEYKSGELYKTLKMKQISHLKLK